MIGWKAVVRAKRKHASRASREERQLADLCRKIERGTENLALAEHDDFVAISKLLTKWRAEEAALAERLEQRGRELEPLPEALRVPRCILRTSPDTSTPPTSPMQRTTCAALSGPA